MELSGQIKKYRDQLGLSQEELAEKIFVTRQSVSNWENGKTYPDLQSLLRLGDLFGLSLDELIKGDIEVMKQEINEADRRRFGRDSSIYTGLFAATILSAVPLTYFFRWIGGAMWLVLAGVTFYWSMRVEKQKKALNIHTYREIVAFSQGERLDEIEKAREDGKRPYQLALLMVASGVLAFAVCLGMALLFKLL